MKNVFILGSTGSIGVNTLNVIRNFPDRFNVSALTVNSNTRLLLEQIKEFKPDLVVVKDKDAAEKVKHQMPANCKLLVGVDGLINAASGLEYDIFVGAMVGYAGLAPTIEAIKRGKRIALANKETLVVAGEVVNNYCKEYGAEIIPVDSEHSAIYQCLVGENIDEVEKLIITASGGPFLNKDKSFFEDATIDEALNHPNWKMGNKVTIDSATMMNKGLEVIEAHWLFGLSIEKIDVVIHPQSIIHSMVQFRDGSIKAQMGLPDMKLPIQYALTYPERLQNDFERTNIPAIETLNFYEPNFEKFECLKLAFDVLEVGGTAPCVLNAANEIAVEKFLNNEIRFSRIPVLIEKALEKIGNHQLLNLDTIFECDTETRNFVRNIN
ncbi:MAG: 1-deoxy-D-xylulose-5-phosphate reductoisomerase [Bacteroidetes bacterium]|nr:1-deoxy-D-xylulose-5-phosphate reductoisomerase [Bacteroidota bacterium]